VLDGGDTGESTTGNGRRPEYPPLVVVESGGWCGWWMMIGTLLGPEGTTEPAPECGVGASGRVRGWVVVSVPGTVWFTYRFDVVGVCRLGWGAGVGGSGCGLVVG
jgi:hypothetical protein